MRRGARRRTDGIWPIASPAPVVGFLEGIVKDVPEAKWEILRVVADNDLVFLHVRFVPAARAPAYAIADLFRVEGCRIVEHWDVVEPPREGQPNPHSRF